MAGAELLQHFGIEVDPIDQPGLFTETLRQIDPRFKGKRTLERYELEADETQWPEETKQLIMRAAEDMRMLEPETPLVGSHAAVLVPTGARQSNLDRPHHAVKAAQESTTSFDVLVFTGSTRQLKEAEQKNVKNYAPGARTEADLISGAARTIAQENPGLAVRQTYVDDPKAGTPDVLEEALRSLQLSGELPAGASVAAVTTQIYQTSTALDLRRVAKKYGITDTYVAGNPSNPEIVAARTPATYLTEVLRTLRAATLAAEAGVSG